MQASAFLQDRAIDESRLTYSVQEVGRILGIGKSCAYEGVRTGAIPSIRIGRRIVVPKHALTRIMAGERLA